MANVPYPMLHGWRRELSRQIEWTAITGKRKANPIQKLMSLQFRLLDCDIGWPSGSPLWTIVEISFGHSTDWDLRLKLERFGRNAEVVFVDPESFRVHDEGELLSYWNDRHTQGVPIGTLYSLQDSDVLKDFAEGVSAGKRLRHFLAAGTDTCVEVIGVHQPQFRMLREETD